MTGATGFVGSHLAKRLVSDGWDVHIIVRNNSGCGHLQLPPATVTRHMHDGTTDCMHEIVAHSKPDTVFHLASYFLSEHTTRDVELLVNSNVLFAVQLVDAMAACGACKLVNTGTSWQHYEDKDDNPASLYAATKEAFESIIAFYASSCSLRIITLKLFDTYGPHDLRPKLFNLLKKTAETQIPLAMSPGEQLLDLVYIDDVVDAFIMAAARLEGKMTSPHESYAVSSGSPIRLCDIVELYTKLSGKKVPIVWGGRPYRKREVMSPWSKGVILPGWRPRVDIDHGILRIVK